MADSSHRYDAIDFQVIDPRLGGEKAMIDLIEVCHSYGLRLVLDAAFTHCHCNHEAFRDLLRNQASSAYSEWFFIEQFPVSLADPTSYRHYPEHPELPLLNLSAAPVIEHFLRLIKAWMLLGVDGLRFDAVEYGPPETWRAFGECARRHNPEVALIAECIFDSPAWAVEELGVHCATDYTRNKLLIQSFRESQESYVRFRLTEQLLRHRLGPNMEQAALQFLDTHDTDRFLTRMPNEAILRLALEHLLLSPEPVLFYYGTELALTSGQSTSGRDSSWPDRIPMPPLPQHSSFVLWVRDLLHQRRALKVRGFRSEL